MEVVGIGLVIPFLASAFTTIEGTASSYQGFMPDFIVSMDNDNIVILFGTLLAFAYIIKNVAQLQFTKIIIKFGFDQQSHVRAQIIEKIYSLPLSKLREKHSAEFTNLFTSASPAYGASLTAILQFFAEALVALTILLLLFNIHFVLTLTCIAAMTFAVVAITICQKRLLLKVGKGLNVHNSAMFQLLDESLKGLTEIKLYKKAEHFQKQAIESINDLAAAQTELGVSLAVPKLLLEALIVILLVGVLIAWSAESTQTDELITIIGVFGLAALGTLPIARSTSQTINKLQASAYSIELLKSFIILEDKPTARADSINYKSSENKSVFKGLKIENLTVNHPERSEPTLQDLNFELEAGETVGIYGASGSGKSTLLMVLMGAITRSKGSVTVRVSKPSRVPLDTLIYHGAYIPQQPFLMAASIKENIAVSRDLGAISDLKIKECVEKAQLGDFIQSLPHGVNTNVGEDGFSLSGGQRQRLAVARALYFEREVIILDEPTSALDKKTGLNLMREIVNLKVGKTIICVTHDLDYLKSFDKIFEMRDGKLHLMKP